MHRFRHVLQRFRGNLRVFRRFRHRCNPNPTERDLFRAFWRQRHPDIKCCSLLEIVSRTAYEHGDFARFEHIGAAHRIGLRSLRQHARLRDFLIHLQALHRLGGVQRNVAVNDLYSLSNYNITIKFICNAT